MFVKRGVKSNTLENGIRNAVTGAIECLDIKLAQALAGQGPHLGIDMELVVEVLAVLLQFLQRLLRPYVGRRGEGGDSVQFSFDTAGFLR